MKSISLLTANASVAKLAHVLGEIDGGPVLLASHKTPPSSRLPEEFKSIPQLEDASAYLRQKLGLLSKQDAAAPNAASKLEEAGLHARRLAFDATVAIPTDRLRAELVAALTGEPPFARASSPAADSVSQEPTSFSVNSSAPFLDKPIYATFGLSLRAVKLTMRTFGGNRGFVRDLTDCPAIRLEQQGKAKPPVLNEIRGFLMQRGCFLFGEKPGGKPMWSKRINEIGLSANAIKALSRVVSTRNPDIRSIISSGITPEQLLTAGRSGPVALNVIRGALFTCNAYLAHDDAPLFLETKISELSVSKKIRGAINRLLKSDDNLVRNLVERPYAEVELLLQNLTIHDIQSLKEVLGSHGVRFESDFEGVKIEIEGLRIQAAIMGDPISSLGITRAERQAVQKLIGDVSAPVADLVSHTFDELVEAVSPHFEIARDLRSKLLAHGLCFSSNSQ